MSQYEAMKATGRASGLEELRGRWAVVPLVAALAVTAVALTACTSTASSETRPVAVTTTIIATAAPAPSPALVLLEPRFQPTKPGYRLVFNDEFAGSTLSSKRWETSLPWGDANQAELQHYTPRALSQRDGVLTITASKTPAEGKPYSSGLISSHDRFYFKYGYTEVRAQVPAGTGLWSGFWMVPPSQSTFDEIDVMEVLGSDPSQGYAVLHYGTVANRGKSLGTFREPDFSAGFHTFAVDWKPDQLVWYVDGVERYRVTQNIPAESMYFIADLAVGGPASWGGPPDHNTTFPAHLKIDYVRVFQRK
jgi:beta-glucanase (GH16 family)